MSFLSMPYVCWISFNSWFWPRTCKYTSWLPSEIPLVVSCKWQVFSSIILLIYDCFLSVESWVSTILIAWDWLRSNKKPSRVFYSFPALSWISVRLYSFSFFSRSIWSNILVIIWFWADDDYENFSARSIKRSKEYLSRDLFTILPNSLLAFWFAITFGFPKTTKSWGNLVLILSMSFGYYFGLNFIIC